MITEWDDLRLFLASWEAGSLSGAAQALGLGQATVSRRMARLEERVGHRLFDRTRSGLVPTEAARQLLPSVEAMAAAARQGSAALQGFEAEPAGMVRVACPPGVAVDLLPRVIPELYRRHPGLRIEILSDNFAVDLSRHQADIALRSERPSGGDLVYRRLGDSRQVPCASPAYIAALPDDATLEDLDWIQWSEGMAHIPMARWIAARLGEREPILTTNSFLAMRAAAAQGIGVVLFPEVQARVAGLVPVPLPADDTPAIPFYLVMHAALQRVPRVRVVADFIVDLLDGVTDLGRLSIE